MKRDASSYVDMLALFRRFEVKRVWLTVTRLAALLLSGTRTLHKLIGSPMFIWGPLSLMLQYGHC